jgi:hypothetical protein
MSKKRGLPRNVGLGSFADITARSRHVRFAPKADSRERIEHVCFVDAALRS